MRSFINWFRRIPEFVQSSKELSDIPPPLFYIFFFVSLLLFPLFSLFRCPFFFFFKYVFLRDEIFGWSLFWFCFIFCFFPVPSHVRILSTHLILYLLCFIKHFPTDFFAFVRTLSPTLMIWCYHVRGHSLALPRNCVPSPTFLWHFFTISLLLSHVYAPLTWAVFVSQFVSRYFPLYYKPFKSSPIVFLFVGIGCLILLDISRKPAPRFGSDESQTSFIENVAQKQCLCLFVCSALILLTRSTWRAPAGSALAFAIAAIVCCCFHVVTANLDDEIAKSDARQLFMAVVGMQLEDWRKKWGSWIGMLLVGGSVWAANADWDKIRRKC
jgi:hypothetical protein